MAHQTALNSRYLTYLILPNIPSTGFQYCDIVREACSVIPATDFLSSKITVTVNRFNSFPLMTNSITIIITGNHTVWCQW